MPVKIAVIGAGSIGFTRALMKDTLSVPELSDAVFAFHDLNGRNLDMITQLAVRDIKANKLKAKVVPTLNRRKALDGAEFVLNTTRIGGLKAFQQDVDIPLKYGVDQCVGDTLCIGGIMYGQRNIPQILAFCKDIREVAAPGCLFLNYANPNAMNTWAANKYGGVTTIGLCHGVQGGHWQITEVIKLLVNGRKKPGDKGYRDITAKEVDIICAGINHQTWYTQVRYNGEDWTGRLLEGFQKHPGFSKTEKVRIDILKRFGYYTTESNGHVSEYVAWYRKRPAELHQWIDLGNWIDGETGGYLRVCTEGRNWFETDFPNWLKGKPEKFTAATRGHEHASFIIESLKTGRVYRGHFNLVNNGCITNLPDDAIVEVPAYVDRNGISVPKVGDLPLGCAAICNDSISVQRLAVEAAVHGDVNLLKQAVLLDPLTSAVCTPPEISQMVDEMLVAQARWLPQYKQAIPAAKTRFASEAKLGTHDTKGAARIHTKTVAEMKGDADAARKNAAAGDKAMAKRKEVAAKAVKGGK
jgi:alpha-galactosidase